MTSDKPTTEVVGHDLPSQIVNKYSILLHGDWARVVMGEQVLQDAPICWHSAHLMSVVELESFVELAQSLLARHKAQRDRQGPQVTADSKTKMN